MKNGSISPKQKFQIVADLYNLAYEIKKCQYKKNTPIYHRQRLIKKLMNLLVEEQNSKHLTDIRGILAETTVDTGYIVNWVENLGLQGSWDKVK